LLKELLKEKKKDFEVVTNMNNEGFNIDTISKITKLSIEKIKEILNI
jgi:hypothetical protein